MLEPAAVERAMSLSLAFAIAIAILGTLLVCLARAWAINRSPLRLLTNLLSLLGFASVYVLSATALAFFMNRQLNEPASPGELSLTYHYVHFGVLLKLFPLAAMLLVWRLFEVAHRRLRPHIQV